MVYRSLAKQPRATKVITRNLRHPPLVPRTLKVTLRSVWCRTARHPPWARPVPCRDPQLHTPRCLSPTRTLLLTTFLILRLLRSPTSLTCVGWIALLSLALTYTQTLCGSVQWTSPHPGRTPLPGPCFGLTPLFQGPSPDIIDHLRKAKSSAHRLHCLELGCHYPDTSTLILHHPGFGQGGMRC